MLHLFFVATIFTFVLIQTFSMLRKFRRRSLRIKTVGFFHPYCKAGGGGERVLWAAVRAIQKQYKTAHCVIYSGDKVSSDEIMKHVEQHFNIKLLRSVDIVHLRMRHFVEDKYYPFCTLLMQSIGSTVLGLEALLKYVPDIYMDTMGYAWTLPIFKFLGFCRVGAYVHYPTISTDMLQVVRSREVAINNRKFISNSTLFSFLKLVYYKIFAFLYKTMGRRAEVVMVNSTWTRNHIVNLWQLHDRTEIVYPPCDVSAFSKISLESHGDKTRILSIAQFRPEKQHEVQIKAFHNFLGKLQSDSVIKPTLVLVGSCRNNEDYERVYRLQELCSQLKIEEHVEFKVNQSFDNVVSEMENASIALHTMRNEHFGIGLVECMAAGLIMIAHDSGGPKMDIVTEFKDGATGFLAEDVESFADAIEKVWAMDKSSSLKIRKNARESVNRFSSVNFEINFLKATKVLFK